jgi:hypothetical protein
VVNRIEYKLFKNEIMENKESGSEEKNGFMQGGGFILVIIIGTIVLLVGIKALFGW